MHRAFHVFGKQMTVKINHEKFRRHKSEYALIFLMGIHQFEVWEALVIDKKCTVITWISQKQSIDNIPCGGI